jgi:hypothetical protein
VDQEERVSEKPQQKPAKEKDGADTPQDPKQEQAYVDLEPDEQDSARVKGGTGRH